MYPSAINRIPELRGILGDARLPHAEDLAERLLTVPVHPLVSASDLAAIKVVLGAVDEVREQ
jgi:dTDP-4-amino-4,6-dideoxygalactose transaminase